MSRWESNLSADISVQHTFAPVKISNRENTSDYTSDFSQHSIFEITTLSVRLRYISTSRRPFSSYILEADKEDIKARAGVAFGDMSAEWWTYPRDLVGDAFCRYLSTGGELVFRETYTNRRIFPQLNNNVMSVETPGPEEADDFKVGTKEVGFLDRSLNHGIRCCAAILGIVLYLRATLNIRGEDCPQGKSKQKQSEEEVNRGEHQRMVGDSLDRKIADASIMESRQRLSYRPNGRYPTIGDWKLRTDEKRVPVSFQIVHDASKERLGLCFDATWEDDRPTFKAARSHIEENIPTH
ncbi:hypothetical protein Tco_1309951 [Tanacetum coccineum]